METAILQTKLVQNNNKYRYTFEAAEAGLIQAEQALFNNSTIPCLCKKPIKNLSQQPMVWWQHQCRASFPETKSYYVIEKLIFSQCLHFTKKENRRVYFYRISSFAIAKTGGAAIILQTTFTRFSSEICFVPTKRKLSLGRLSWCQLK